MFFQNPFTADFRGNWVLGDRNQSLEFPSAPPVSPIDFRHKMRADDSVMAYIASPYNLNGNDADGNPRSILTLIFAIKTGVNDLFKNWSQISVNLVPTEGVAIQNVGSGYQGGINLPTSGGSGTGLRVTVSAVNGVVVQATVSNPGSGYSTSTDVVTVLQQGSGNNATLKLQPDPTNIVAVTADTVCQKLNSDPDFSSYFIATYTNSRVTIKQKFPVTQMKFYVQNGGAEEAMQFNARAGVAQLPTYFLRHSVGQGYLYYNSEVVATTPANVIRNYLSDALFTVGSSGDMSAYRFQFPDSNNMLVALDPINSQVDFNVVQQAVDKLGVNLGYLSGVTFGTWDATTVATGGSPSTITTLAQIAGVDVVPPDWQLLRGRSGLFMCQNIIMDSGNNLPTQIIEWQIGAQVGDMAKKTIYDYTTNPNTIREVPYTLTAADLNLNPPA